jgi:hypothetical protein
LIFFAPAPLGVGVPVWATARRFSFIKVKDGGPSGYFY